MTTKAHTVTRGIADAWEGYYASAVLSGIVGDAAHLLNGGYHISIEDNRSTNYSVIRPDDKAPPGTWPRDLAAAIDMSMNPADMKTCSDRLWWVWNDTTDPRHAFINGFNGWFNDGGPAKRYDFVTQGISTTTSDHKWHVHLEIRRRYVPDQVAAEAIKSVLRGESKQQYLDSLVQGGYVGMYAQKGMGLNGTPISHDTMYAQAALLFLAPHAGNDPEHPLTVDGKYGSNTAWWTSIILTGGPGEVIDGQAFFKLNSLVVDKKVADALAALPPPATLPDQIELVIPATTIQIPAVTIPATTVTVDVNPVE